MSQQKQNAEQLINTSLSREEVEKQAFDNQEKLNEYQRTHNRSVLTRRDLLATGVVSFAGTLMSQSIFSMLFPQTAQAQVVCAAGKVGEWIPLITVNLQGGANLSSHWMPMDKGGQMLPSYSKLGWGKAGGFGVDYEFSNKAPFFGGSSLLEGLRATASAATLSSSAFVGISVTSQDDSASNPSDITGLARGIGLSGKILPNIGTVNTGTGNGTMPAFLPPPAPLIVSAYDDLTGALGVGGSLQPLVAAGRAGKLFETMQKLSAHQAGKYLELNGGTQLQNTVTCRTQDNAALVANPGANNTDPRADAGVAQVWGLNNNTSMASRDYVFGSLVFNALNGNAGSANLNLGGYDYHDGTRQLGDNQDRAAGRVIGQIMQTASVLGKKVFIMVTTDGATTSAESDAPGSPWASDGGVRGAVYMIAMNPSGAPASRGSRLGYMNADQGAADPFISSPDRAAAAVFVNWLNFNGKVGQVEQVLPRVFSNAEIDKLLRVG